MAVCGVTMHGSVCVCCRRAQLEGRGGQGPGRDFGHLDKPLICRCSTCGLKTTSVGLGASIRARKVGSLMRQRVRAGNVVEQFNVSLSGTWVGESASRRHHRRQKTVEEF